MLFAYIAIWLAVIFMCVYFDSWLAVDIKGELTSPFQNVGIYIFLISFI